MNIVNSGAIVKKYRSLLKISQKEAAGSRMSHSMVSLIESGKIQLTTVTAMVLADNFNKIAESKGIELNLSLKDLLSNSNYYVEEEIKKSFREALESNSAENEFTNIFEKAKESNCFEIMAEIKLKLGKIAEENDDINSAISQYKKSLEYFALTENIRSVIEVKIFLAHCYSKLKEYSIAEEYLEKLKNELSGKGSDEQQLFMANMELLNILFNTNRYSEALKMLENMLKSKRLSSAQKKELLMMKVNIHLAEKKYDDAINILRKLLSNNSSADALILHKLSILYFITESDEDGSSCLNQCIKYLNFYPCEDNTKTFLILAEELDKYGLSKYSIQYYESALLNAKVYDQKSFILTCYKSIFHILESYCQLDNFENYAKQIEQYIFSKNNVENLTHYILILSKFYLRTYQENRLVNFLEQYEKTI